MQFIQDLTQVKIDVEVTIFWYLLNGLSITKTQHNTSSMANRYYIILDFYIKGVLPIKNQCKNKIFDLGGVFIMIFRTLDI